jgi:uncharacterized membrane protein
VDLVIIIILTLVCFPVITFSEGILRIILGVVFLLIFPGYTLMAALFPNKNSIRNIERAAFTVLLSFALVFLAGFILNYTPWGITLTPIYITVSIIIVLASGVAFFRRTGLPKAERFSIHLSFKMPKWGSTSKFDRALAIILAIVVIGAFSILGYVLAQPKPQEPFSNFYVLGADGQMANYPQELTLGEQTVVTLGIDNHELQDTTYNIKVTYDGIETQAIGPITLTNEGKWSNQVTLSPSKIGDNQKVEFLLYKGEDPAPNLSLHLWLNVKE